MSLRSNHSGLFSKIVVLSSSNRDVLFSIGVLKLRSNSLKNICEGVQLIQIVDENVNLS